MIIGTQILDRKLPSVAEGLACDRLFLVLEERVAELHPDLLPQLQSALPEATCRT
ncbi:MAG: 3-dehydroquinate synthase, partial [Porphyromonadaceae bacterium]|nr:3-dehydroquinate synthase [Porphyromonadaceae bacterium]